MPSSGRPVVLLIAVVLASLSTAPVTALDIEDPGNSFRAVDCQSSSSSSGAPSPSQSSTGNGNFGDNLNALLGKLPSTASTTGFASLYEGEGTDRAFVRGLCRGDTGQSDCQLCLVQAVLGMSNRCNSSSRRAAIWYGKCSVTYSDTNASTAYEQQYRSILYNVMNVSNKDAFENTYNALMSRLAQRVVNGSGTTTLSSLTVAPMFATGEAVYDPDAPNGTMYGTLQCMRDRTAAECNKCLQDSIPQLPGCCYGHQGGVVLGYDCQLRVEVYTYYDLTLDAPPPVAPAPASFAGESPRGKTRTHMTLAVIFPLGAIFVVAILLVVFWYKRKGRQMITHQDNSSNEEDIGYIEMDQLNLSVLKTATNNFGKDQKLGEGGFGEVFKGVLPDGEVIAVKRLSKHSSQGVHELKNELTLVAKLKHRNLVRLMGVCLQEEKLLVYEYMPNRSLDTVLFDPIKRQHLDWSKRFMIICGIARGLLYLHEESCLKVIHRDLKPSNVLLDADLNPKISDFGLARAFVRDQSRDVTIRPVGTLGYMSPEYAYYGHVSTKSDMFSFGVIILEIVTGRRSNSMSECPDSTPLLSYVWGNWKTGSVTDVVDASLGARGQYPESEVLNCIEVGLLCVQENPDDRPDASSVVLMLTSPTYTADEGRRAPSRPAFVFGYDNSTAGGRVPFISGVSLMGSEQTSTEPVSKNEVTISEFKPR